MALLPDSLDFDTILTAQQQFSDLFGRPHPEGIRIWSRFFTSLENLGGIIVPHSRMDFVSMILMDPTRFNWAKSFLESLGSNLVIKDNESRNSFTFCTSKLYPSQGAITCLEQSEEEEPDSFFLAPATPKHKAICSLPPEDLDNMRLKWKALKAPLVCTKVRRSERLKELNKGYKATSCNNEICLCCETRPPTLSARAMRSLGKDFCNIPTSKLSDENLKKKQMTAPGSGTKKVVKPSHFKSKNDEDKKVKKKPKKN
jgi:hypothetical protein